MRITYHVAASEDGFIAAENGDITWLEDADIDVAETGLVEFMTRIDGMVMGRRTYDFIVDYGSWPYGETPAWICTTTEIVRLDDAILTTAKSVGEVLRQSAEQGLRDMWLVGGGELASSFLDQNLITDICVTQLPIRLGQGIPLFSRHRLTDLTSQSEKEPTSRDSNELKCNSRNVKNLEITLRSFGMRKETDRTQHFEAIPTR